MFSCPPSRVLGGRDGEGERVGGPGGGGGVSVWVTLCIDGERAEWVHDSHGRDQEERASAAGTSLYHHYYDIIIIY